MAEITLELHSPITEEEWDIITDVDLDNTPRMIFHTKHGKEVEYVKVVRCKDCLYYIPEVDDPHKSTCQRLWGGMTECKADSYCSDGVRKDEVK